MTMQMQPEQKQCHTEQPATDDRPFFICGSSRSGTALVRSILNAHSDIHIAGETHYFDDLRIRLGEHASTPLNQEQLRIVQDYFLAISHRPYGHQGDPEKGRITREELAELALSLGNTGDSYLAAFCQIEARANNKTRWGEKTPRHMFRINDMLTVYPKAKVICLVRDPRAIVASYRDWRNQGGFDLKADPTHAQALKIEEKRARKSYHPLIVSMLWKGAIQAALESQRLFGTDRVRLQRYEHLAFEPEEDIKDLAAWLEINYEDAMASPPMHNSSYNKFKQQAGVSSAPVDRWKSKLSPGEIATVESFCGPLLKELGYDLIHPKGTQLKVAWSYSTLPFCATRAAMVNRDRIPNLPGYITRRLLLALGMGRSSVRAKANDNT